LFKASIKSFVIRIIKTADQIKNDPARNQKTNIRLNVPYFDSQPGNCGLACIQMLLGYYQRQVPTQKQLTRKYKSKPFYYLEPFGWTQQGLITILDNHGLPSISTDYVGLSTVIKRVGDRKPVIVSIQVPSINNLHSSKLYRPNNSQLLSEGHLVIITGIKDSKVLVHDPRNIGKYTAFLSVDYSVFNQIYSGRYIYAIR